MICDHKFMNLIRLIVLIIAGMKENANSYKSFMVIDVMQSYIDKFLQVYRSYEAKEYLI